MIFVGYKDDLDEVRQVRQEKLHLQPVADQVRRRTDDDLRPLQ